jgi:hypothetical protein
MTIKDYADILKFAINGQIKYEEEALQKPFADESYEYGIITGLRIALQKIDASAFLWEERNKE